MAAPVEGVLVAQGLGSVFDRCLALRTRVFVDEQGVPVELEADGLDAMCMHYLVVGPEGEPLCCARSRMVADGCAKAERVAVRADLRGSGLGRMVMQVLEAVCKQQGAQAVVLGAQVTALPFYEKMGYAVISDEFMDAGIPHRRMKKDL